MSALNLLPEVIETMMMSVCGCEDNVSELNSPKDKGSINASFIKGVPEF